MDTVFEGVMNGGRRWVLADQQARLGLAKAQKLEDHGRS
jgi:hypothetical protein